MDYLLLRGQLAAASSPCAGQARGGSVPSKGPETKGAQWDMERGRAQRQEKEERGGEGIGSKGKAEGLNDWRRQAGRCEKGRGHMAGRDQDCPATP